MMSMFAPGDSPAPIHPLAGTPAPESVLVDVPKLVTAYYSDHPDPADPSHRVVFGTSGHRGSSLRSSFNEAHVLAITQAICLYRQSHDIGGPLFLGWDTHALSDPARVTTMEVLAGNGVDVMISVDDDFTPTPVISRAILAHNRGRRSGLADGIVVTPSHNPPEYGGIKYDPPSGGPAATEVSDWIQDRANRILVNRLQDVLRIPWERARHAATVHRVDFLNQYVRDLPSVIDVASLEGSGLRVCVDPLGGAAIRYWEAIGDAYRLDLTILNRSVDPAFSFMALDSDGAVRMDPSSRFSMAPLIERRNQFDLAIANDPDADRYGIVSRTAGLLTPNESLATSVSYLFSSRPDWSPTAAVGKTIVTSSLIDRVAAKLGRRLLEVPVGFKFFVDGLLDGSIGVAGEESAGASFLRRDGTVWATDKDGIIMGLLALESMTRTGREPGEQYADLAAQLGESFYERVDLPATREQKVSLSRLEPRDVKVTTLGADPIRARLTATPEGNGPIGGIKVVTEHGWFAARPSGTEEVVKLYAESFRNLAHLRRIQEEACAMIQSATTAPA